MSSSFGSSNKRTELNELNEDLNSTKPEKKKEAIKKVIAHMTVGKDVGPLFQSVIKCLEIPNIEIKKLVYLYIINYSRTRPDDAIMVVNLFRKDVSPATTASPLIRALAVRTMGCLRVKKLNEYLGDPLKEALNDEDPYVRKTAALCIPKVYELNPDLVENGGMIEIMQKMLQKENNALVVSNLVIALREISDLKGQNLLALNQNTLNKLLLAVNETIEWGQVFILDNLVKYTPQDTKEAENIIDRVIPRLSHINPAVVLSAVKVILRMMDMINNQDYIKSLCRKMAPSIVTLLSGPPEIAYVILRNINFILQKRPNLLDKEIKGLFCNHAEPYYVKFEKLDILSRLCDAKNYEVVLNELYEYSQQFDVDFVRKSIRAIGKIVLRVEKSVDKAITILMNLFKDTGRNASHVIQEVTVVMQQIYRKYPGKTENENSLKEIIDNIKEIVEPEAKAAVVWMIGDYCEKITKSEEIIEAVIEGFLQEETVVQLQILTAAVKVHLKLPSNNTEEMIYKILQTATDQVENPDIRDRAYIYWRMLSVDPEASKKVVLSDKPLIQEETGNIDIPILEKLVDHISSISSVYHKPPEAIFKKAAAATEVKRTIEMEDDETDGKFGEVTVPQANKGDAGAAQKKPTPPPAQKNAPANNNATNPPPVANSAGADLLDLLDMGGAPSPAPKYPQVSAPAPATASAGGDLLDLLGDFGGSPPKKPAATNNANSVGGFDLGAPIRQKSTAVPFETVLSDSVAGFNNGVRGVALDACFVKENQRIYLLCKIRNNTDRVLSDYELILRPNFFGLQLDKISPPAVQSRGALDLRLGVSTGGAFDNQAPSTPLLFSCTLKSSIDLYVFNVPCMFHILLDENGELSKDDFKKAWKTIPETNELMVDMPTVNPNYKDVESIKKHFGGNNIFYIASRTNDANQRIIYFSAKSLNGAVFLVEVSLPSLKYAEGCSISCKSSTQNLISLFLQCSSYILTASSQNVTKHNKESFSSALQPATMLCLLFILE